MLTIISWIALGIGILSSIIIAIDVIRHPQMMWIMNLVWVINGWFFGPVAIWTYYKWGRLKTKDYQGEDNRRLGSKLFMSTSHCAAGCTFGDVVGVPIVALTGATILGMTLFAHFMVQFIFAYIFGVLFQFFAIYPMNKQKGKLTALKKAIKADTLSLIAFEVGMFGWMAIVHFLLFTEPPEPNEASYWFMMQIAMIIGFGTSFPANWFLIKRGIKEAM